MVIDGKTNQIIVGAKYVKFCFWLCMLEVYLPLPIVAKFRFCYEANLSESIFSEISSGFLVIPGE